MSMMTDPIVGPLIQAELELYIKENGEFIRFPHLSRVARDLLLDVIRRTIVKAQYACIANGS